MQVSRENLKIPNMLKALSLILSKRYPKGEKNCKKFFSISVIILLQVKLVLLLHNYCVSRIKQMGNCNILILFFHHQCL